MQAKKVEKHLKKHAASTNFGYTDEDNPFNDQRLSERFVWGKKIEKQLEQGADVKQLTAKAEKRRQTDLIDEIEKVKQRREQREAERAALAEELELIQRERAMAEAIELEKKEEEFHVEQIKVRARQRMEEGRPKAIDLITNNLFLLDGFDPTEEDPPAIVGSLNIHLLRDLHKDVIEYKELDAQNASHTQFWTALEAVVGHELAEATKQDEIDRARVRGLPVPVKYAMREAGWHESLDADVAVMLSGKCHDELLTLENGIHHQLVSGAAADPEYWQAVLRRLHLFKAKALLREFHADMMLKHLEKMASGMDLPKALVSGRERAVQAREEAEHHRQRELLLIQKEEKDGEGRNGGVGGGGGGNGEVAVPTAAAAPINEEEIVLPDIDEEDKKNDYKKEDVADTKLEKLAAVDIRLPRDSATARDARRLQSNGDDLEKRGEPLAWDELTEQERAEGPPLSGDYSPKPIPPEYAVGHDVIGEDEDLRMLQLLRLQVRNKETKRMSHALAAPSSALPGPSAPPPTTFAEKLAMRGNGGRLEDGATADPAEARLRAAAAQSMGDLSSSGDAPFGGEVALDAKVYWWHEKYKPRKPKYFNRVHTGFDWNKYNRTHYDSDNPPPKVVQGYKFNIFYPDLIDHSQTPSYVIEKDPSSPDGSTCIIRFTAGPPYEDITFRIVNREWSYDTKRGFKCVFERGILHVYFNFKKQWYRR